MKHLFLSVIILAVPFGCSLFANSRPSAEPGKYCWVFPGYGKICAESEAALLRLRATLPSPSDAGAP
jgi:hypothetical protein